LAGKGKIRPGQEANQYSLASFFSLRGVSLLEMGDLSGIYEKYAAVPADLLKAAHHGSPSSTGPEFLAAVNPRAILLSCRGLARYDEFRGRTGTAPVFSTTVSGALTLRFDDNSVTVIPFKPSP
jgi:competence protein ComEC